MAEIKDMIVKARRSVVEVVLEAKINLAEDIENAWS